VKIIQTASLTDAGENPVQEQRERRVKLGIDGREFQSPGLTGIGRYIRNFLNWLSENRTDVTPVVFLNQRCRYSPPSGRVQTVTINEHFTPVWDQVSLPAAIKAGGLDVFISPYVKMPFAAGCPVVLIINDLIPLRLPARDSGSTPVKNVYFRLAAEAAVKRAAAIISISEFTKNEAVRVLGAAEEKIEVVRLGLEPRFRPTRGGAGTLEKSLGLAAGEYILYVGQFRTTKNTAALIRAYSALGEELKDKYRLVLGGGESGEYERLRALANSLGLAERVLFTGYVSDEELPSLLSNCAVFVYPSLYEGFGYPPLEAMACGAPVISSGAASLKEISGEAAMLVDPPSADKIAEAMTAMLSTPGLADSYAEKGVEHARAFTVESMSKGFMRVAEKAAGSRGA